MTTVAIELIETDYKRLEHTAKKMGTSVQGILHEWISQLPEVDKFFDVTKDPVFQMEGYDSEAPPDLSTHLDDYLYGESYPK